MEEGTFLKAASPSSRSRSPESLSGEGHNPTDLDVLDWGPWTWNKDLECAERIAIKLDGTVEYDYRQDIPQRAPQDSQEGAQKYLIIRARSNNSPSSLNTQPPQTKGTNIYHGSTGGFLSLQTEMITKDRELGRGIEYEQHSTQAFRYGRIFQMIWPEAGPQATEQREYGLVYGTSRYWSYSIRQFVIIKGLETHCLCLPFIVYDGYLGPSIRRPGSASVFYEVDGEIVNLSNEEENQQDYMSPIRLDISYPSGSIDTFQQLDYREIWTIGYNVKVKFIGGIHDQSLSQFTRDYEKNQELLMNSAMSHDEHTTFMPVEQNEEHIKTQAEINSTPVQPVAHSTLSVMSGAKEKFPKWAHDALQKVWPEQREHAFKFQIDYKVIWELPRFLSAYFPAKQDLRNVLTLTGDEKKAQAVSCGQYMSVNFPHSSLHLLEVIQNYLDGQENKVPDADFEVLLWDAGESAALSDTGTSLETKARLRINARYELHLDFVSALSWLCAAIRHGTEDPTLVGDLRVGGLSASKAVLVASLEPPKITIALLPLIPIAKISETNMCWHSIFSHTVIAYDFPIPGRHEGQGLEVTFDTMVQLTRCLRLTQYDDGLVAEGPECLLIPEKELPQDDALQWHLQWKTTRAECRKTGIPRVLTLDILADRFKSRYVTDKPEKLQNRRGFLGWTHTAHIVVGTAGFLRALRYTEQPILNEEGFHRVSHNIGFGLSALPASLTLQVQVAQAYDGNVLYHSQQVKSLRDRLDDSEKSSIIIYDTSTGTGWQIPESSVILYMVQLYIQRLYIQRGHDVLEPENETLADMSLLSAALEPDGGRAALKTLKACLDLRLSKEGQVTTLSEQVDWFLNETSSVEEFLSGALQKARKLKKSPPNCLIGVELLDVVDQKCSFGAKLVEFKKPQPWSYLSEEACLVLLCRDIGQAIVPARPETLCRNWRQVPEDQNFLVATARVIRNYLEPLGGRILSFKFLWKFTGSPIQMHTAGERRPIRHTQTLHPFSASSKMLKDPREYPQMDPEPMLSDTLDGGLIFREPKLEKSCTLIIDAPLAANIQVSVTVQTNDMGTQETPQQAIQSPTVLAVGPTQHQNSTMDPSPQNMTSQTINSGVLT